MAKKSLSTNETIETIETIETVETTETAVVDSEVFCNIISRAAYTIPILEKGQRKFIPPFGKLKVAKNDVMVEYENDAKLLTFQKI